MIYNPDGIVNTENHLSKTYLEAEIPLHWGAETGKVNAVSGGCWKANIKKDKNKVYVSAALYRDIFRNELLFIYTLDSDIKEGDMDWLPLVSDVFRLLTLLEQTYWQNFLDTLIKEGVKYVIN